MAWLPAKAGRFAARQSRILVATRMKLFPEDLLTASKSPPSKKSMEPDFPSCLRALALLPRTPAPRRVLTKETGFV